MAGDWRPGGHEAPGEHDRPERPERQADGERRLGDLDESKISDKSLLSFFGYKNWDDWLRAQEQSDDDPLDDDPLEPAEGDQEPERERAWKSIAEEHGEVKSYHSYSAAKRDLGSVEGMEIHHVVEQGQAGPSRSGFGVERINTTDNMTRIPEEAHRRISGHYSRHIPGTTETLRDALNGASWEYQTEVGREVLDKYMEEHGDDC